MRLRVETDWQTRRGGLIAASLAALLCVSIFAAGCRGSAWASQPAVAQATSPLLAFDAARLRTDAPVADGAVSRTWIWGPLDGAVDRVEHHVEAAHGRRSGRYFSKSRMELTDPDGDTESPWYVTNGLLVFELMTGRRQIGNSDFETCFPAAKPVAGDLDNTETPTYEELNPLTDLPAREAGAAITERTLGDGSLIDDPALAAHGTFAAERARAWSFADGTLVMSGHDEFHPPTAMNVMYGDASGWSAWEPHVRLEADGSAVFRWTGVLADLRDACIDLVFFDEDLNEDGVFDDQ